MKDAGKKSAKKSGLVSPRLPDGRVAPGRGPKKGAPGAGRPRDDFRQRMQILSDRAADALEKSGILDDPDHPKFEFAIKHTTEHGRGRPAQPLTGADGTGPVQITVVTGVPRSPDA